MMKIAVYSCREDERELFVAYGRQMGVALSCHGGEAFSGKSGCGPGLPGGVCDHNAGAGGAFGCLEGDGDPRGVHPYGGL